MSISALPPALSAEVRKIHQYLTFAVNTPAQLALADMLRREPAHWQTLPAFYRQYRDHLVQALAPSRLKLLPCEGTYFLLADYSALSDKDDVTFRQWLTTHVGVAAILLSVFCAAPFPHKLIRLCFGQRRSDVGRRRRAPMSTLAFCLLQQPLVWMDGQANLAYFDRLLEPIGDQDLIVLPEMFTTGFAMEAAGNALPERRVVDWLAH